MTRHTLLAATLLAVAGTALAAEYPAGARSEDEPQMVAFYQSQCTGYADENGLQGDSRDAFIANCMKNAPAALPVGIDPRDE